MSNKFSRLSIGFISLLLFTGGVVTQAPSYASEEIADVAGTWKMTVPG